ncbi:MAG: PRTRC system ThiF family protein [Rhodanobacter sp.]
MSVAAFPTPEAFLGVARPIRALVVGAGGTGCQVLDGLASLDAALRAQDHAGFEVTVMDDDVISASNIGRQRYAQAEIGFPKCIQLVRRINGFHTVNWVAQPLRLSPNDPAVARFDLVLSCVDKGAFRADLGRYWKGHNSETLWLDTGNGASRGQCVIGHLGKPRSRRLPNVFDLYGNDLRSGEDEDLPSCSVAEALTRQHFSVNRAVATAAIALLDDLIHRGGLDAHGTFLRTNPFSAQPLRIDPAVWATFGYVESAKQRKKKTA